MSRGGRVGVNVGASARYQSILTDNISEELIKKAASLSMKAHKSYSTQNPYLLATGGDWWFHRSSREALFCFGGSWSIDDWFARTPFGETKINAQTFPSIRSIGNDEVAVVNEAFLKKFEAILSGSSLRKEVEKAVTQKKKIVFAGHSSGGPIAILATLWFLENCFEPEAPQPPPCCVTFGSPLVGDRMFPHALRRENWSRYFIHFVMKYDIVPRILLAPLSSIQHILQPILHFLNRKSTHYDHASEFYTTVMNNAASVASHAAGILMGSTNSLFETLTSFIELSPFRPFGTYVFCTGSGKLVVVQNPDAVLQLLFYSLQLSSETEGVDAVANKSLKEHLGYEKKLKESLNMQSVAYLDNLDKLPISSDGGGNNETLMALNDLGLSTVCRLRLRAAGELEKQKLRNQENIDAKKSEIKTGLEMLEGYQNICEVRKVGYYDAFKLQNDNKDFEANVERLKLAGIWDEIIEMLKRYELPEEFEVSKEWIDLGTRFRRIVEPLDIANYYRHLKNEDAGPYMKKGRPRRYKYTQRWREHAEKMPVGSSSEICFWAELEELRIRIITAGSSEDVLGSSQDVKDRVLRLEEEVSKWVCDKEIRDNEIRKDVLLEESSFLKWWKTLPDDHKEGSCIAKLINV